MEVKEKWLDGWVLNIDQNQTLIKRYDAQCHTMKLFGRKLFEMGAVFKQGGNFAIRDQDNPSVFIVTAHGSNKGWFKQSDFLIIRSINWQERKIFADAFGENSLPSTDVLLIGQAFIANPELNAWVHFHKAIKTPHEIRMDYPVITEAEMMIFSFMVANNATVINLIDHDSIRKTQPNNQPDSAIIL